MSVLAERTRPLARRQGLVIQELSDEVLVYDLQRDKAHCLNQTAALVWKKCDGKKNISELSQALAEELGVLAEQDVVWLAVEQLSKAHLLSEKVTRNSPEKSLSRRQLMKRLGVMAAGSLPVITTILSPQSVQAATCANIGQVCSGPGSLPCCPGLTCQPTALCG